MGCPAFVPGFPLCGHGPSLRCRQPHRRGGRNLAVKILQRKPYRFVLSSRKCPKSSCFRIGNAARFVLSDIKSLKNFVLSSNNAAPVAPGPAAGGAGLACSFFVPWRDPPRFGPLRLGHMPAPAPRLGGSGAGTAKHAAARFQTGSQSCGAASAGAVRATITTRAGLARRPRRAGSAAGAGSPSSTSAT